MISHQDEAMKGLPTRNRRNKIPPFRKLAWTCGLDKREGAEEKEKGAWCPCEGSMPCRSNP